jgi:hypothetical protein
MEAWAFSLAMATDDDHRAFCQQQLDKAREHYVRDCEREMKVMTRLMSDDPITVTGAKVGSTISIKLPTRYTFTEPADDWDGPAELN